MNRSTRALWLSLVLALSSEGCIALARESYTSLRGPGAVALEPAETFEVSSGRMGHEISQSPSLARANLGTTASVTAAICDWDPGVWFIVFPPLPLPLFSLDESDGSGHVVVRLTFDGNGTWRAPFADLALVGPDGVRAAPERYRLVTRSVDTSLEPCARETDPHSEVAGTELAVFGPAELWLRFTALDWPDGPRALELGGLSFEAQPLPLARLELDPGARWFWYRVFP